MKNQKALIIGNYGNYNIGDETLLEVAILDLLEKENDIEIYIPVRDPEFINIYHTNIIESINSFYVYDIKALIKHLFYADKVIIGGGGLWDSNTGRLTRLIPIFLIMCKMLGKQVIIRSVGVYDTASKTERILVNLGFLFADRCSVRDKESFNNIWSINKKIKIENDLALELPGILKKNNKYENMLKKTTECDILDRIRSQNKYIVGISIRRLNNIDKTKEVAEKISNFINIVSSKYADKVQFVFFPFSYALSDESKENDLALTNDVINKTRFKDNITVIPHMNPIVWCLLMKFVDIMIGMRYHSIVFSFINGKPFVAIPYENKVWNFMRDNNCKNVLPLENFDEDYLVQFFENNFNSLYNK